jgi:hypothetical protein
MSINNNECTSGDFKSFQANYSYNKNKSYPLGFMRDYKCPPGYSILGDASSSSSCFITKGKTNLNQEEKYDELAEEILPFDDNKKFINDDDYLSGNNREDSTVRDMLREKKDNAKKFIVKSCPVKHPNFFNENLQFDPRETRKTRTTTNVTCNYQERISRTISKKDSCLTPCDGKDERILCGNGGPMEKCEDDVNIAVENCKRTHAECWRRIHEGERNCVNDLGNWPPCYGNMDCRRGLCNFFVNKIGGEVGCGIIRTGCDMVNVLGGVACAAAGLGPKICGQPCPGGYISEAKYITDLPLAERRIRYPDVTETADNANRKEQLRKYQYVCIRKQDFKLCNQEREVEIGKNSDMWEKYCRTNTNLTDNANCLDAATKSNNVFSMFTFDKIYYDKCNKDIDLSELSESIDPYGKKVRNKFSYEYLAKKLTDINVTYKMKTPLPIINVGTNLNEMNINELSNAFTRLNLILDIDIIYALKDNEFNYTLELANCSSGVKAYKVIFKRLKFASSEDDCCLNRTDLFEEGRNYYQNENSDQPALGEKDRVVLTTSLAGSLQSCKPELRTLNDGGICQDPLYDYCKELDDTNTPRILAFADAAQTDRKYKRCSIDYKKKYRTDYDNMVREICNDYQPATGNSEGQNFLKTNNVCKEFCKADPKNCEKGMLKYCSMPFGPKENQKMNLFESDCQEFFSKRGDYDKVLELRCVIDKLSPIYNDERCKSFRDEYEKCLINEQYKGTEQCKKFYEKNPNITAKKINNDCDINPSKKYCSLDITQKDIYGNEYNASANKKEAALNIKNSDLKLYNKASEKYLIDFKKTLIEDKILEEQTNVCLNNKVLDGTCKNIVKRYMNNTFKKNCVLGRKDAFEVNPMCEKIRYSKHINFNKEIEPYCENPESGVYSLPYCQNLRHNNSTKSLMIKVILVFVGIIIFFGIFGVLRKKNII